MLLLAALQTKAVQNYLLQKATVILSDELQTKVQIESVDIPFFNRISLKGVYVEDRQQDTLLYAKQVRAGFSIRQLFKNRIVIKNATLTEPHFYLAVDTANVLNLRFIIDAFRSDKPKKTQLVYELDRLDIKDGAFRFDNRNFDPKETGFDGRHIFVTDLNTTLSVDKFDQKVLIAEIEKLSLKEKSGVEIKEFSAILNADTAKATLRNLMVALPKSKLEFDDTVRVRYDSVRAIGKNIRNVKFDFRIKPSTVYLPDLQAFAPNLARLHDNVLLSTDFHGSFSNMKIKNLAASYDAAFSLNGDFEFSGLPDLQETFIYAKIKNIETNKEKLQDFLASAQGKPVVLPEQLSRLGTVHYEGNISGLMSNLVAYGQVRSNIGLISTDILLEVLPQFKGLNYSGKVRANNLKPYILLGDTAVFKEFSFNLSSKGEIRPNKQYKGDIDGVISSIYYNNYLYKNISVRGDFDPKEFRGNIRMDDPNGNLNFQGVLNTSSRRPSGAFKLAVENLNLYNLHLIKSQPDLAISAKVKSDFNFSVDSLDSQTANVLIDSILLSKPDRNFFIRKLYLKSIVSDSVNLLTVDSRLVQGVVKGQHSFRSINKSLATIFSKYLPIDEPVIDKNNPPQPNNFIFYLSNFNVNKLAEFMDINLELSPYSSISGFYNDIDEKFRIEMSVPYLRQKKTEFKNLYMLCNNAGDGIDLITASQMNAATKVQLESHIAGDSALVNLSWNNDEIIGSLDAVTLLKRDEIGKLLADIEIIPSEIWIKNEQWNIQPSEIHTDFKTFTVHNLSVKSADKFIDIQGVVSKKLEDSLVVNLRQVPLNPIMQLVRVSEPKLDAEVSGHATIYSVLSDMMLDLDLDAKDFSFNDAHWGDVKAKSRWNTDTKSLNANCLVINKNDTITYLHGSYSHKRDSLDFIADARGLPLDFLRYYLNNAVQNVSGKGTGKVHLFGSFKRFMIDGDVDVKNGQFDIDFLKTTYHFSDIVHVRPTEISIDKIQMFDKENNSGIVSGRFTHKNWKDMRFNFNATCKNILAMNTKAKDNPSFYGRAYGTGTVAISGTSDLINFNINMRSEPHTRVVIPMGSEASATESSFIKYVTHADTTSEGIIDKKKEAKDTKTTTTSKSVVKMALQLEATPDAEIVLITDPVSGDSVQAVGRGNLRLDYASNADMRLSGRYEVEKGNYNFSMQQIVKKPFTIRQGSSISWSGDPYHAIVNIDAVYTIPSVSLNNILESADLETLTRTTVPVNCLLNLTGDLMKPNIKFDIEIPSESEIERRVKAVINNDEQMNREIIALLAAGQFIPPPTNSPSEGGSNIGLSALATTLSGQLNNMLGQMLGQAGDKFNVGVSANVASTTSTSAGGGDYDVALSYKPNNRLIISTNIGYHNNTTTTTTNNTSNSPFTSDIDVEYKLTRNGKWRAKAYNHSADNYYYDTNGGVKMTQGVGIMYREEYNKFSDVINSIFRRKKTPKDTTKVEKDSLKIQK